MKPQAALARFESFLKEKKLRMTGQRRAILLLAWETHDHFTADDMFAWVRDRDASASRATVYRTLALLVEGGFLDTLQDGRGQTLYEHILGHAHHDHMVCIHCGRILEFRNEEIERLQEQMAELKGFTLVRHTLRLEGYCARCRQAGAARAAGAGA